MNSRIRNYQICTRCVMDTSDPEISFDQHGVCNLCADFIENRISVVKPDDSGRELANLFESVKKEGVGRKYDCVIGVSGGVDSSILLCLAVDHGLNVLAVHMDNGWNSPIAVQNIKRLVDSLGVDYESYVLPWDDFRKTQVAFLKASVPEVETPTDIAIQRAVHHFAVKYEIRCILSGGNITTEGILPVAWHYNSRDMHYTYAILKASRVSKKHFSSLKYGFFDEFRMKIIKRIRTLYPLNYFSYDKDLARIRLEKDHGWKYYGSKHGESRFTKFIQNYYLFEKHGIDYRRATASSELCAKKIDRSTAISRLQKSPYEDTDIDLEKDYISKKLGLSRAEFDSIINESPQWYFNYSNNEKLLSFGYNFYRLLKGHKKTSNF
jgi:N-acetyl sugar amidotransferase